MSDRGAGSEPDLGSSLTLGVVISIPQPHATVLRGWRQRVGDPLYAQIPPHVTLLPPTEVERSDLADIEKHLRAAAAGCSPFPMHLAGTGTFRPLSPVVFIQVARGLAECEVLESAIRSGPLERELEFPYHPHVTVAHHVPDDAMDAAYDGLSDFVARFAVRSFQLFEHDRRQGWILHSAYELGST
jgi:2'-5' RNA ligase